MSRLPTTTTESRARTGRAALLVAAGIFLSRIAGLVRQRVISHYFGLQSDAADAWAAGFRIPNALQNLFGEGALSASFIPVYAALVARGERRAADRVAGAVASLLALAVAVLVLVGVLATPLLIALIAPGFAGQRRELTITVVRILFPGAGLLVLSAWCLGVLNSHHRFLLSYAAPVVWSAAMIGALLWYGPSTPLPRLAAILAWASVAGSALQCAVQIPAVRRVAPDLRLAWDLGSEHVRTVIRNFLPVLVSRGVVQVSAYVDALLASFLPLGAPAGLASAQLLYTLPVSLFGMSIAAAELPAMAGESIDGGGAAALKARVNGGLRRMAFFVIPSSVTFLAFGDVVAAAVLQTGRFHREDAVYVWMILAGSSVGLLAQTFGRLYASASYALRDTRTPLRFALVRVGLTTVLGYVCAMPLPRLLGIDPRLGAVGLSASAGVAGWVEMLLLREALNRHVGPTGVPSGYLAKVWASAGAGAAAAWALKVALPPLGPVLTAGAVLGTYGLVYLGATAMFGLRDARDLLVR